ncbi:hypothetical protein PTSG_06428 [Salpingoeca rosetta]|uniref:Ubiquitin-activating enzyme SCCH domain-containing protein n=1 Tax=Salpingoeca rosetta (strain ATCC 50818 / BSB-021) TaxID=946362 RepID=F2UFS4_SALR5|nr:uncharacterized protein PTSG_06428 [Salpingoeca rosetta]EGD75352.1 hypothetical protein PTSG_06428 [Salpingoeca rosetta]|eukprot:XP_004991809.1 hypothetical protein PTSG_06428 [Salpingoeca rosetta]
MQHVGGERIGALERGVDMLKAIKDLAAELQEKPTMETCVSLAWRDFHAFSRDVILDLIATFPAGAKTKSGEPFWSDVAAWFINKRKVYPVKPDLDDSKLPPIDIPINAPDHADWRDAGERPHPGERKARSSGKMPEATGQGDAPTDKSIKRLAQEAGLDTKKKKLLVFDDVALTNEDGDADMQAARARHSNRHGVDQGRQAPHRPLYSRVFICGLGGHEAERTIIFEDPFPGAELACAAASGGTPWVIQRWQKEPYQCKLHRVPDLKCMAVVLCRPPPNTRAAWQSRPLCIAGNKTGVISLWQLGEPSTLLAEWRADVVGNGEETIQDVGGEAARGEVEAEPASKEPPSHPHDQQQHNMKGQQQWRQQQQQKQQRQQQRHAPVCVDRATLAEPKEVTGVRVPHIAAFADSSNKLASACGNTVHVYAIEHHQHDHHQLQQRQHDQQQQQQQQQERQQ